MKQRVAIARGMAMEPDVLLMDEPFAALDALTRRRMQDELLQLWEDTRFTVLFVTHSIEEAIRIGTRILLLSPSGAGEGRAEQHRPRGLGHRRPGRAGGAHQRHAVRPLRAAAMTDTTLAFRPEILRDTPKTDIPPVEKAITPIERIYRLGFVRKTLILLILALLWEGYGRWLGNPLLFPSFSETFAAFLGNIATACCRPGRRRRCRRW